MVAHVVLSSRKNGKLHCQFKKLVDFMGETRQKHRAGSLTCDAKLWSPTQCSVVARKLLVVGKDNGVIQRFKNVLAKRVDGKPIFHIEQALIGSHENVSHRYFVSALRPHIISLQNLANCGTPCVTSECHHEQRFYLVEWRLLDRSNREQRVRREMSQEKHGPIFCELDCHVSACRLLGFYQ